MYSGEKAFKKMQNYRNPHFNYMGMRVNVAGVWGLFVINRRKQSIGFVRWRN
ncbi:hypothetical protein B4147_1953 [Bacillus wiedmannii]|uniref:Uncharacterized protein n=1 Tax=Bacillus wiedmannii TaxID=1890302 RepID=A0A0G8BYP5_9BACI|nr:hypothetical protein B4147_1953 [Bacillus wiedmannii]